MTKSIPILRPGRSKAAPSAATPIASRVSAGVWKLNEAKARFSEVVKRARSDGPQRVTVRGAEDVIIMSATEYSRSTGEQTGKALFDALRASPHHDVTFDREPMPMSVRDIDL